MNTANIGGLEKLVTDLVLYQKSLGFEVAVLLGKREGHYYNILQENQIEVFESEIFGGYDIAKDKIIRLSELFSKYEIIHFHYFSAALFRAAKHSKIVYTAHGQSKGIRKENFLKYFVRETIKRYYLNKVDFLIANSHFILGLMKKHYGLKGIKMKTVYNGIPLGQQVIPDSPKHHDEFLTVGSISRFVDSKKMERAVISFEKFLKLGGKGELYLIGDGATYEKIKKLVEELNIQWFVHMPGFSTKIEEYYREFDVCIFPYTQEPFGLVAVEAYNMGKAVYVFADSGGLREIVEGIEPENIAIDELEMAQKLFYAFKHKDEIFDGSLKRVEYAQANFAIERMEREYEEIYESLLLNDQE